MNKLIPQEYDEVILKTGELVCLMDQLDATHFLPDYGVETPEQEKKTMYTKAFLLNKTLALYIQFFIL